ncbi:hypothetical protein G6F57_016606 [Rhizopus arrhizus]|nr:hypothetical protein G6F57_016606 [Rhizopus arrhizus]
MGKRPLNHSGRPALYSGRIAIQGAPHVRFHRYPCPVRLPASGAVRPADRLAGFLDGLESRGGQRSPGPSLARRLSAPHLWLRCVSAL